jgi:4a-hydroxytetrahydrobiopterin dehydratase
MATVEQITARAFHAAEGLADWRVVGEGACTFFRTGSFAQGAQLVQAIGQLDGLADHQPDLDVRWTGVMVRLITITPDYYGLSQRDLELAREISRVAREVGVSVDPSVVQTVQVTIDALDIPRVMPFWRAVLGYADRGDSPEDLVDPLTRGASFWFQQMAAPRPQRNRLHIDIWVAYDQAEPRIAAALAAGGRLISDNNAPAWWVLADPEGNEACIATTLTRD